MKTIPCILLAMLVGGAAIAEEANTERPQRPERPIPPAILKEFDKDGDGKLSQEERAEMREIMRGRRAARHKEMLQRFDADGDGKLSDEERKLAHETILKEMLLKYDANGNGELEPEERRAMVEAEGHNPLAPFMRRQALGRGERGARAPRGEGADRPRRGTDSQREGRQRSERRSRAQQPSE